jgi:hypothetical protein
MRLGEGQQLVNFTVVAREEESDEEEVELDENATEATEVAEVGEAPAIEETAEAESEVNE